MKCHRLQAKEVALMLNRKGFPVTDDTIRNWCLRGIKAKSRTNKLVRLAATRVGGRWFFTLSDVRRFLASTGAGRLV